MADPATSSRVEPNIGPAPVSAWTGGESRETVESSSPGSGGANHALDQLSRIEDKTARIEEKYARSESILQRVGSTVEAATSRMQEVASQAELVGLRSEVRAMADQVRRLPGKTALVAVALVTSLLTAAIVLMLLKLLGAPPR